MSGIAFVALLSAFSTGQVGPNHWQQWNQQRPGEWSGAPRFARPYGWVNGQRQLPADWLNFWDWRLDPWAGVRTQTPPGFRQPRPLAGRYYGPGPVVRQSLTSLSLDSPTLQAFRKAIDAMRKLPPGDPHSLIFQANIHGYPDGTRNPDPLWGQCQHGSWWFLSWHRAHLYYFEKIVRRYAEDPNFAMPYWDWSAEQGRSLPEAFRDPASPLYDDTRIASVNNGTDQLTAAVVVDGLNASMANTVFADFGQVTTFGGQAINTPQHRRRPHGALEAVPHDSVHGFVGGNVAVVGTGARDPIFYCHHANVDRLWVAWLQLGQGRANPADEVFLNQQFTFYDENKQHVSISTREVLDITALGYTYDSTGSPPAPPPSSPTPQTPVETVATLNTRNVQLQSRPVTLTMTVPQGSRGRFRNRPVTGRALPTPRRTFLELNEAHLAGAPDSLVAVYINLPPYSAVPGPRSPHLAGYFTFFGDHHHMGYSCRVDVTRHLQWLWQNGSDQQTYFTVTLVRTSPGTAPRHFRVPINFKELSLSATR